MRNIMFGWRSEGGKNLANTLKKLIPANQKDFFAFASKETFSYGSSLIIIFLDLIFYCLQNNWVGYLRCRIGI